VDGDVVAVVIVGRSAVVVRAVDTDRVDEVSGLAIRILFVSERVRFGIEIDEEIALRRVETDRFGRQIFKPFRIFSPRCSIAGSRATISSNRGMISFFSSVGAIMVGTV